MRNVFITPVEFPKHKTEISYSHRLMSLGSCFSEHIGKLLTSHKFTCDINPFGVLYNPLSIANALTQICENHRYTTDSPELIESNGWHSLMHHSTFSALNRETCIHQINQRLTKASNQLSQTDCLLLTFGSAYVYRLKETGQIVGNCHKLPNSYFTRELLTIEEITAVYTELIKHLQVLSPKLRIIFTVSPIRHLKDGMHGNQISKSTLLLAIDKLIEIFPDTCFYFPSYEIMMDELRDYRFYADDMLHPTPLAVSYIWERFTECYFNSATLKIMNEWNGIMKALAHKPFQSDSDQYKTFLSQLVLRIERLKEKYPNFDIEKEITLCRTLLNK